MKVELVLFGHLTRYLPEGGQGRSATLEVPSGSTVAAVLDSIGLPDRERGYVTVGGERAAPDVRLADGDQIRVIVPLGGG